MNNGNRRQQPDWGQVLGDFRDRLTKIETILEMRVKQGDQFMQDWGVIKSRLDTINTDVHDLRSQIKEIEELKSDVVDLRKHQGEVEKFKARAVGLGLGIGVPVTGHSAFGIFDKLGKLFGSH